MSTMFSSARHQAALDTPTGYRRWMRFTFQRGGVYEVLEPISGSITQDARRGGRWDGRLTFAGDDLIPRRPGDLLTPFGTTVEAVLGLELLDGSVSYVPYGYFDIASSKVRTDAGERVVDVSLIDLSERLERYRFESPLTIANGVTLPDMINAVVINRTGFNPGVGANATALGADRVFGLDPETGPWSEILDVVAGFSRTAYYDRVGHIQLVSINPDPATAYPLGSLTSLSSDYDTRAPNVIVVRGEPVDGQGPVQVVVMDTDPGSPTYAGAAPGTSPYGRVTKIFASPLIINFGQANSAAATLLASSIGAGATHTMVRPYDPTIDASDVVTFDGTGYAVDAITVDLTGDTTMKVREL